MSDVLLGGHFDGLAEGWHVDWLSSPGSQPPILPSRYATVHLGSASFTTTPYLGTPNNVLNPGTIVITYSTAFPSSNYLFGYAILQIDYRFTNNRLNYSVQPSSKTAASATLLLYTDNANYLYALSLRYITIAPLFGTYYFSYCWFFPQLSMVQGVIASFASVGEGPFNSSGTYQLWITMAGVDATLASNNKIDLYPNAMVTNATTITYTVSTISTVSFYLRSVLLHAFIYNRNELSSLARPMLVTQANFSCLYNSSTLSYADPQSNVRNYNTIIGIKQYHIFNQASLQYTTNILPNNIVSASTNIYIEYSFFDILIFTFNYCPSTTPYYMVSQNICYDVCPQRYYTDSYGECQQCLYDCYLCIGKDNCTACNET